MKPIRTCEREWHSACSNALDPTRPELYTFLASFLQEMGGIFEDDLLFLGGDELDSTCFDESPSVAQWMKEHGLNASSTQQYFWQQMTQLVRSSPFCSLSRDVSIVAQPTALFANRCSQN